MGILPELWEACGGAKGVHDGGELPRLRRLMAGGPRARGIEPDHRPEAIPEAIITGATRPRGYYP